MYYHLIFYESNLPLTNAYCIIPYIGPILTNTSLPGYLHIGVFPLSWNNNTSSCLWVPSPYYAYVPYHDILPMPNYFVLVFKTLRVILEGRQFVSYEIE